MTYARIEDGAVTEYPIYQGDILLRFPNTSFPVPFEAPDGYEVVKSSLQPQPDYTENIVEGTPEFIDGVLTQFWILEPASSEEIEQRTDNKAREIRSLRNSLLAQCDWTQLPDSGVDKQAWAEYRQELRDVPNQQGFPWQVVWPEKP